jgi:hypothetical protein
MADFLGLDLDLNNVLGQAADVLKTKYQTQAQTQTAGLLSQATQNSQTIQASERNQTTRIIAIGAGVLLFGMVLIYAKR